jgi:hypothetical protein
MHGKNEHLAMTSSEFEDSDLADAEWARPERRDGVGSPDLLVWSAVVALTLMPGLVFGVLQMWGRG